MSESLSSASAGRLPRPRDKPHAGTLQPSLAEKLGHRPLYPSYGFRPRASSAWRALSTRAAWRESTHR
jgi:hypothetical protein